MSAFDKLLADLRKGENIDLYVSVVAGFVLAVLNLFGLAATWLSSIILAILAILAASTVRTRHNQDTVLDKLSQTSDKVMLQSDPPELIHSLETASDIFLIGAHLSDYIQRNYSVFNEKLKHGATFRVLIYPPDGAACKMTAMRFAGAPPVGQENARIQYSLNTLGLLRQQYPDRIKIRTLDFLLSYNYYLFDVNSPQGVAVLDRYTFRTAGGNLKPRLIYTKSDARWFDLVVRETEQLWEAASGWPCADTPGAHSQSPTANASGTPTRTTV
jgi:hypothetical protein